MFGWRLSKGRASALLAIEPDTTEATRPHIIEPPARDTTETRRAARTDLLAGIGHATETNLALGKILRDAFGLVDEMAAFSREFDLTAETTRARADQFVASVCNLQSRSDVIESRLTGAAGALENARGRSRSAFASVEELTTSIDDVERVINMIADVAAQTNLLALNATIEAARAGAAGAGFRVVAGEVKALSQQTRHATDEIVASVKRIRDRARINMAEVKAFDETVGGIESVFGEVRASVLAQGEQTRDIGLGSEELATLAQNVRANAGRMQALGGSVKTMTDLAEKAATSARRAFTTLAERAESVLRHGDSDDGGDEKRWPVALPAHLFAGNRAFAIRIIDLSAEAMQIEAGADLPPQGLGDIVSVEVEGLGRFDIRLLTPTTSGYETVLIDPPEMVVARIAAKVDALRVSYRPYIDRVRDVAAEIMRAIEAAIARDAIDESDLFDTAYRRDGETEPAQYMNAAVAPLEAIARALVEPELGIEPRPDFCILQDRHGFNPVHNALYSRQPRVGDIVWNLRHARARRIFDDRVGMAASRNLRPFIVQSYARDMGDSIETRMEFDAPLFFRGRHWGAVRMAYRLASD